MKTANVPQLGRGIGMATKDAGSQAPAEHERPRVTFQLEGCAVHLLGQRRSGTAWPGRQTMMSSSWVLSTRFRTASLSVSVGLNHGLHRV